MRLLRKILCITIFSIFYSIANAEVFTVKKIEVNGLKRISMGTVLSYLHDVVKVGDRIDTSELSDIIRALYKTSLFSDVTLRKNINTMIINVVERPVISSISISGNSKITKKQLKESLKNVGIAEGQELDLATLNAIKHAIIDQYRTMSMYAAKVSIDIKYELRNRTVLVIKIEEGPIAKIKSIRIIGNKAFKERTLLNEISLTKTRLWSFLTDSDKYSNEKLEADLEKLRSYYMDRGYLNIKADKTKVLITSDKKELYIEISIAEGGIYRLGKVSIGGDLIGKHSEILKLITIKPGDVFSRKKIIAVQSNIHLILGNYGYALADIKPEFDVDEKNKKVQFKFIVNPRHRVYIRRIDFRGNHKTNDEVLRREMRLQEGSLFSLSEINESSRRIANLGYIQDVGHKINPVIGSNNQVDLEYNFKETSAISFGLQGGYSDRDGFLYGANLSDQNIFGTGKNISISLDNTKATQYFKLGYRDPYFTNNKMGLSASGYVRKTNPIKISRELSGDTYSTCGTELFFDIPLSDYNQVGFGLGYEHINIHHASNSNPIVKSSLDTNGTIFDQLKLVTSWSSNKFDKIPFPTKGYAQSLDGELYLPADRKSLDFYKLYYNTTLYVPLIKDFIFRARAEIGYGNGFGKTGDLFFLKNFFAGGIGSVRGFDADSLTNDRETKDKVIGGNILTLASVSIIFPTQDELKDMIRSSVFVDVGDVYNKKLKLDYLRVSCGVQIEWRTPLGAPLLFSFATPLHKKDWDSTSMFQFSIGLGV